MRLLNLYSYFSQNSEGTVEGNMEITMQSFIIAKKDDIEIIIKHLKQTFEALKELNKVVAGLADE